MSLATLVTERAAFLLMALPVMTGAWLLAAHRNLLMAVIGLYLVQTGVIFFFVLLGARIGASLPVFDAVTERVYANPLPHALMLTAIVVGVATLGMALAILRRIQDEAGSLDDAPEEACTARFGSASS